MAYIISSGITSDGIILENDSMTVLDGGIATNTTLNSYGSMYISSGGTANSTTVNIWGSMFVSNGGTANKTMVNSIGHLFVFGGGKADRTTVNSIGYLTVSSGGTANSTTVNLNGYLIVSSGGMVNSTTVSSGGNLYVSSGGTATDILWTPCEGHVYVLAGGAATFISEYSGVYYGSGNKLLSNATIIDSMTLSSSCEVYVMSGGTANNTTINGYGAGIWVSSGGTAKNTTVNSNGSMHVLSGGTATNIIASQWARLYFTVAPDTYIQGTMNGSSFEIKDAIISGYSPKLVELDVFSGGTAIHTIIESGRMTLYSGGKANSITVFGPGGGSGGFLTISSGGSAQHVVINNGNMNVVNEGTADFVTVYLGNANVSGSGGCLNNTTVYSGGVLRVSNGGILRDTTIYAGGSLDATFGGKITGVLNISNGAKVGVASSTILDFDISNRTPSTQVFVNNFFTSLSTKNNPSFTLTVSESQLAGLYALANDAFFCGSTITVQNTLGDELGVLSLDKALTIGETTYTLYLDDSLTLTLSVKAPDKNAPTVSNIQASTTELTNQNVVVTAEFADDEGVASALFKLGDNGLWLDYPAGGVTVYENGMVYFKAVDAAG